MSVCIVFGLSINANAMVIGTDLNHADTIEIGKEYHTNGFSDNDFINRGQWSYMAYDFNYRKRTLKKSKHGFEECKRRYLFVGR